MKHLSLLIGACLLTGILSVTEANENILPTKMFNLSLYNDKTTGITYYVLTADGKRMNLDIYKEIDPLTEIDGVAGIFSVTNADTNTTQLLAQYPTPEFNTTELNGSVDSLQYYCLIKTHNNRTVTETLTIKNALKMNPGMKNFKGGNTTDENGKLATVSGTARIVIIGAKP